ncbi:MAG: hypothetical protein H0S80_04040 [Desulfovibrionaceae bacterium]|nr:hypothetical protein [Desulfovibrionaceae bacterium]
MIDYTFTLKDSGLVASNAAGTVGGFAKVADVGNGLIDAELVIDVSAIEIASNDEIYSIAIQGSDTSDFTTGSPENEELAVLNLGAAEVLTGNQDSETGRYVLPFRNEKNGSVYPYLRVYTSVDGDVATGINFTAHLQAKA